MSAALPEPAPAAPSAPARAGAESSAALSGLVAGAWLAAVEIAVVLVTARDLFLSAAELGRFAAFSACVLPSLTVALALFGRGVLALLARGVDPGSAAELRRVRLLLFAAAAPACGIALWLLTAGRRARALPGRAVLVAVLALAAGAAVAQLGAALLRARRTARAGRLLAALLLSGAALALVLDALLLRRLYPALHVGLAVAASVLAACASAFIDLPQGARAQRGALGVAGLCAAYGLIAAHALADAPNARFAIRESAPLSGKLLALAPPPRAAAAATLAAAPAPAPAQSLAHAGIDLRGKDILLVTVDALRADRLRAYGGTGLTPAMDALAEQSVVFLRAYTPTPHTSYAIASLFTGKFMQPLLSLAETADDHPTLPELLRHHGYRTAAFYPPAIFFVDEERFAFLRRDHLGFEYVKEMFASAEDRVGQLEAYLREVTPGYPVFVWVHLFEPHEPYDPPPAFARGDRPIERYDGEVAAVDAALRRLISRFRALRPGATVVLTADHGEEFGDHGGHHHGTALYDEHVRVPLLWSSPGAAQPRAVDTPVEILDVTTTLLAALGIPREARMRGDDLSAVLAGAADELGTFAFSSIEGQRMWTDGRRKLICGERECRMFDLLRDPGERRDVAHEQPEAAATLRGGLAAFVASLPSFEALAMSGGGAWPEALARARLGDAAAGPELVPLLSSPRADVRAAAARALGELSMAAARNTLSRLRESDGDALAAGEAAIAALRLGELAARDQVRALLGSGGEVARRAALALAAHGDRSGQAILLAAALDHSLEERERIAAIRALGPPASEPVRETLVSLLSEVRLRPEVARALGRLGDRRARRALEQALRVERYPDARKAEAEALLALGARAPALALTRRFLGTTSSLPDGVALLRAAGALARPSGGGADLVTASEVREGEWRCADDGCTPLEGAAIALPVRGAPRGPARAVLRARVEGTGQKLRAGTATRYLDAGEVEVAFELESARGLVLPVEADGGVRLQAIAVVPAEAELPPPAPEPAP